MTKMLNKADALDIIILATCEAAKNILVQRNTDEKRLYRLGRLEKVIEEVNLTYHGHLPDLMVEGADAYHKSIERAVVKLMKRYKEE
jgi:UDP-N-acetyl-D-mannosaminuronic acid transferase (WecB/TagA/CpsF family)